MSIKRIRSITLAIVLLVLGVLAASPSMAATVYAAPYSKDATNRSTVNDSALLGSVTADSTASKLDGSLSIDVNAQSNAPTGVQAQPQNRRPPIINVGRTDGSASASIEQGVMSIPSAGTYAISVQLDGVGVTKTVTAASPTGGLNLSDALAASSFQVYVYCYWNNAKSYSYVGIGPATPTGSSMTLTGSLACGGSGHIKTIVTLSGFASAKGTSSAHIQTSGTVTSITLGP